MQRSNPQKKTKPTKTAINEENQKTDLNHSLKKIKDHTMQFMQKRHIWFHAFLQAFTIIVQTFVLSAIKARSLACKFLIVGCILTGSF